MFEGEFADETERPRAVFLRMMTDLQSELEPAEDEELRLASLGELELLDSPREVEYDQLVELAAEVCGTPMSAFTLVDRDRQWFKATLGLDVSETGRDVAFCAHAIQQDDLFVVEDASRDERFRNNALVTGEPHIRFYAGMPLAGPAGAHLGTLCVLDTVPRQLSASQRSALKVLALQVKVRMEKRLQERRLRNALEEKEQLLAVLRSSEDRFRTFMDSTPFLSFMKDGQGRFVYYNTTMARQFGIGADEWMGKSVHDLFPAEMADQYREADLDAIAVGGRWNVLSRRSIRAQAPCPTGNRTSFHGRTNAGRRCWGASQWR